MRKRIAIAGASGTGKTAVAEALAAHYGLGLCPVGSRQVSAEMGYATPYDVDRVPGARARFQRELFERKARWEAMHDEFVTDRSVFDNLAYTLLHCPESVLDLELEMYFEAMGRYTLVAFLPIAVFQKVGDDPARKKSRAYHLAYECILESLLVRQRGCVVYKLDAQSTDARVAALKDAVDRQPY